MAAPVGGSMVLEVGFHRLQQWHEEQSERPRKRWRHSTRCEAEGENIWPQGDKDASGSVHMWVMVAL
jgi:hypothetical protein